MSTDRLPSTGRRPALAPADIERMLTRYFSGDAPTVPELATEFSVTNSKGVVRPLSQATVRKYLKAAGIELPRGKAAVKERTEGRVARVKIQSMMNRIPTEMLIGDGQTKLLVRLLERGEVSQKALAEQFGISKDRIRRFKQEIEVTERMETQVEDHGMLPDGTKIETEVEEPEETTEA